MIGELTKVISGENLATITAIELLQAKENVSKVQLDGFGHIRVMNSNSVSVMYHELLVKVYGKLSQTSCNFPGSTVYLRSPISPVGYQTERHDISNRLST